MALPQYIERSKKIRFNGKSSADVGVVMETFPDYNYPERQTETIHIPGLNGDVLIDDGTYKNVKRVYRVSAYKKDVDFHTLAADVVRWLHPSAGYKRLEDDNDPNAYRMATVIDEGSFMNMFNMAGTATITFNCKPQRYLTSGEVVRRIDSTAQPPNIGYLITNPTAHEAKPLIVLHIKNGQTAKALSIKFANSDGLTTTIKFLATSKPQDIFIDCEMQDAYAMVNGRYVSVNSVFVLSDNRFPILYPGDNRITVDATTWTAVGTGLEVTPRWWTL